MITITADEIKTRLDAGEPLHLVDVREPDERAEFNIGGSFVPLGNIQMMLIDDIDEFKNEEVICYCRSGKRSMQAGRRSSAHSRRFSVRRFFTAAATIARWSMSSCRTRRLIPPTASSRSC